MAAPWYAYPFPEAPMLFALLIACADKLDPETFAEDYAEIICSGAEAECLGNAGVDDEACRESYRTMALGHYDCEEFDSDAADACLDEIALEMSCDHMTGGVEFQPNIACSRICAD